MPVSDKARQAVMERANGHCQFWHSEPFPADQISHKDHQGHGGLPATHWKNLPPNLAASCGECHARFHQGRVYMWEEFDAPNIEAMNVGGPVCAEVTMLITETNNMDDAYRVMKNAAIEANMGRMVIRAPNGQFVPESDLWFYQRWEWFWAEDMSECLKNMIQHNRNNRRPKLQTNIWRIQISIDDNHFLIQLIQRSSQVNSRSRLTNATFPRIYNNYSRHFS